MEKFVVCAVQPAALLKSDIHYRYFSINLSALYEHLLGLRSKRATLKFNVYYVMQGI